MIGMDMRLDRPNELQAELGDEGCVAAHLFEHRVDQHCLARGPTPQQIGVGRRRRIEELSEDEHALSPSQPGALALSMAATSAASSLTFGEAIRSLSCCRLVALTIGAVMAFRCINQASAT